jgi:hypothetical protein
MAWFKIVWSEFFGLFVDDGRFAIAILAWLAACGAVLPRLGLPPGLPAVLLFAGLVVILVESATRHASGRRGP